MSKAEARDAIERVKGQWWDWDGPRKRYLNLGYDGKPLVPWLVRGLRCCWYGRTETFTLPDFHDVLGQDLSDLFSIKIEPRVFEASDVRAVLPEKPHYIVPHRDFPIIVESIRCDMYEQIGPYVDQPY